MAKSVLILDDSELVASMLAMICDQLGHTTTVTLSLAQALEHLAAQGTPDVVVTDLNLPDAPEGPVSALRGLVGEGVPIYLISGMEQGQLAQRARELGADGSISKDGGMPGMFAALEALLN